MISQKIPVSQVRTRRAPNIPWSRSWSVRSEMVLRELRFIDRKAIHNLKYFTWVEQQGKTVEELDALWSPMFWDELPPLILEWDDQIRAFNAETGVLENS